ncbi:MAG: hypothetical protein NWF03_04095 [Candidatus Bathyarchaeota archaeon]|nr:hypothetical protein [Candidatus Bathyarchaeota archaeon]
MRKKYIGIVLILGSVVIIGFFAVDMWLKQNENSHNIKPDLLNQSEPTAALVDALCVSSPDNIFTSELVETLNQAGFSVDIYAGKNVTVDLLKTFPESYDLLVLRMHSAVHSETLGLYLFTAEPYSEDKYVNEQYFQLIKEAYAFADSEPVFAVNWMFVKRCMAEKFCNTTVIVMGCDGACDLKMATEFFNQGAKAYIAWNGLVIPSHSSKATLQLVENLYIKNFTFQQAVENTNKQIGPDPNNNSTLTLIKP